MKLKKLLVVSGLAFAMPVSLISLSLAHAIGKDFLKAHAGIGDPVPAGNINVGWSLSDGVYYKNDGSVGSSSEYNIHYDQSSGTLTLNNFKGTKITTSVGYSSLNIEVLGDENELGGAIGDGVFYAIQCGSGSSYDDGSDLTIGGTGKLKIDVSRASKVNSLAVGIWGSKYITIKDSVSIDIDLNDAKSPVAGIRSQTGLTVQDSAELYLGVSSVYEDTYSYGITTEMGQLIFNSSERTDIYFGSTTDWADYAIVNQAKNSLAPNNGKIEFTGSGRVNLANQGSGYCNGIASLANNNNQGSIIFDNSDVLLNYFSNGVRCESVYAADKADVIVRNGAKLEIGSTKGDTSSDANGITSLRNGVLIDGADYIYEGTHYAIDVGGYAGWPTDTTYGFDVLGASHVDIKTSGESSYIRSKSLATCTIDLSGDGYFNYQKVDGSFPNTGNDNLFISVGDTTRFPYAAYMTATDGTAGKHYFSYYNIPYRLEAYTPPISSAVVGVNINPDSGSSVSLSAETPCFVNNATEAVAYTENYNAYYERSTGKLHLKGYNGGGIMVIDSASGATLTVVLEGSNSTITSNCTTDDTASIGLAYYGQSNSVLEITSENTSFRTLTINVSNTKSHSYGIHTMGSLRVTGKVGLYGTAEVNNEDADKNAMFIKADSGYVSFEGHSKPYFSIAGTKVSGNCAAVSAHGSITFNTLNEDKLYISTSSAHTKDGDSTYCLFSATSVQFTKYKEIDLTWSSDYRGNPVYPEDSFDSVTSGAVNVSTNYANLLYGAPLHYEVINASFQGIYGAGSNLIEGQNVPLVRESVGSFSFKSWELSSPSIGTLSDPTSQNSSFTALANGTIVATYDFYEQEPFFDTRGSGSYGYIHFKLKAASGLVTIVKADFSSTVYGTNVTDNIQFDSGMLPGEGASYRLCALYSDYSGDHYLYSEPFTVDYSAEAIKYNLTFKPSAESEETYVMSQVSGNVLLPTFEETGLTEPIGYKFVSWGGYAPGAIWSVTDNATLIAQFVERDACTLTFSAGEGSGSKDPVNSYVGYEYTLPTSAPEFTAPDNYVLDKWIVNGAEKALGATIELEETAYTIVAHYSRIQCTITFDHGEGTGLMDPVIYGKGLTYTLPTALENEFVAPAHKQFKGWSIGGVEYAPGAEYTITGDVTVTAVFEDIMRTVTFAAGDGSGTMAPVSVAEASSYVLPECGFTAPEGKEFDGWMVNGVKHAAGDSVVINEDTTITATWKDIPVTPVEPDTPDTPATKKGLSGGAIAAIVVVSVIVGGIGIFALVWFVILKKSWAMFVALFKKK